jgi:hypothetical protein
MPDVSRAFVRWRGRVATALGAVLLLAGGLVVVTGSVAAAAMSAQGVNFSELEEVQTPVEVGTFTDTTPSPASGYTVSINWGDGTTYPGSVAALGNGTFEVDGTRLSGYATDGTYTVTFSITETGDDHDSATATTVGTVGEANRGVFGPAVSPISASEGTVVSGTIATFTDVGATDPASNFTATIDWGDGTTTAGVVTDGSAAGDYVVSGTHQYTDELSGSSNVTISEPGLFLTGSRSSGNTVTITEADALTMTGSSFSVRAGRPFSGTVATFTDTNPVALSTDFATTINWGDGTTTSGNVTGPEGGPFTITGSHTYKPAGTFKVTVTAADDPPGTATASATATATVTHGRPPSM